MKNQINHICPKCGFYIKACIDKHINSCDGRGPRRKIKRGKRGGWNKGISYIDTFGEEWTISYKEKIKNGVLKSYQNGNRKETSKDIEMERRKKISDKMKEVGGGYRKGSGRGKKGRYKGFWCDSSWELAWVIYHIEHNIKFDRNHEFFNYEYNGKTHKYYPDFIINGKYYEIKGYESEKSNIKIKSFIKEIEVVDKHKIKPFVDYAVSKYGKDFIKLYEKNDLVSTSSSKRELVMDENVGSTPT